MPRVEGVASGCIILYRRANEESPRRCFWDDCWFRFARLFAASAHHGCRGQQVIMFSSDATPVHSQLFVANGDGSWGNVLCCLSRVWTTRPKFQQTQSGSSSLLSGSSGTRAANVLPSTTRRFESERFGSRGFPCDRARFLSWVGRFLEPRPNVTRSGPRNSRCERACLTRPLAVTLVEHGRQLE